MTSAEELGSLAQHFISVPDAKAQYRAKYATSKVVNNYIFYIQLMRENARCGLDNDCKWFAAQQSEREYEDLQNMVLCITCDNVYHLRCSRTDFAAVTEQQLPWMCAKCLRNPMNADAQGLVSAGTHTLSFDERIKCYIKVNVHKGESSDSSADEYVEGTVHIDANGSVVSNNLRTDVSKLQRKYKSIKKSNKELRNLVVAQSDQLTQIMELLKSSHNAGLLGTSPSRIAQGTAESLRPQYASFTNAVLNANIASTRIDDEIKRSSQVIEEMIGGSTSNEAIQKPSSHPPEISDNESHIETTLRQLNKLSLNEIRRNLPKIEKFDRNPERWLTFERAVMRNWKEGEYTDDQIKSHIRQALTGQALARVDSLYLNMSSQRLMDYLKDSFGNASIVVESARSKLMSAKLSKPLTHASCVEVTTRIANFLAACSYAGITIADTSVSSKLHMQLEPYHQELYYKFFYEKNPKAITRMERLDVQFEFLNSLSKTLPLGQFKFEDDKGSKNKEKDYQMMTASCSNNTFKGSSYNSDDYKYEIRDNQTATYLGYNLEKVKQIPKKCEICSGTNHYTVECKTYREMKMDERYNTVRTKHLCINCLLSTQHFAKDCDVKRSCGFKVDKSTRCSAKHHITLHRGKSEYNYSKPKKKPKQSSDSS
ncbi:hypothetical protein ACKWTF_009532 [Chironomus riparius]